MSKDNFKSNEEIIKIVLQSNVPFILNTIAQILTYDWTDEYKVSKIKENSDKVLSLLGDLNWETLTLDERQALGFSTFGDAEPKNTLIPLYIYPYLPKGIKLMGIDGSIDYAGNATIDTDIRFGCIPYRLTFWDSENTQEEVKKDYLL